MQMGALGKEQEEQQDGLQNVRKSLPQNNHKFGFQQVAIPSIHLTPNSQLCLILGVLYSPSSVRANPREAVRNRPT